MSMTSATIRMDSDLKSNLKDLMDTPNTETIQAMRDVCNGVGLSRGFSSVDELIEDLDADD